ncbi:hypothetical protein G4V62_06510 [Bacillaceae bacterium SIJ1]|uniref:hypothetical protein n=1 Tax=Litoribacterium kuwaitense TaxID=1398745 RepID=UPI0013EDBD75|nr:hypothetical protein [Litoribacterium kuwaitense]NGP44623.1 hypothetical protein [Litoribacterium kuwaitense]
MPELLVTIAWIIIGAYAIYRVVTLANRTAKQWFPIAFYLAIFVIALSYVWPIVNS